MNMKMQLLIGQKILVRKLKYRSICRKVLLVYRRYIVPIAKTWTKSDRNYVILKIRQTKDIKDKLTM